jgi:hypothetical protein
MKTNVSVGWRRALDVCAELAEYVCFSDLLAAGRGRSATRWRWLGMLALDTHWHMSSVEIGRVFSMDHSTVLHGLKRMEALLAGEGDVWDTALWNGNWEHYNARIIDECLLVQQARRAVVGHADWRPLAAENVVSHVEQLAVRAGEQLAFPWA